MFRSTKSTRRVYAVDGSRNSHTFFNGVSLCFYQASFVCFRQGQQLRLNAGDDPVAALVAGWHLPRHRRALLIATVCFTVFGPLFTLLYVYPINAVLFEQAGRGQSPHEIQALVNEWIFRDRVRFAIGMIAFAAVLHAFRLPIPGEGNGEVKGGLMAIAPVGPPIR